MCVWWVCGSVGESILPAHQSSSTLSTHTHTHGVVEHAVGHPWLQVMRVEPSRVVRSEGVMREA